MLCASGGVGFFFFQAEDGIRDLVRSRGLGDVYKRQFRTCSTCRSHSQAPLCQYTRRTVTKRAEGTFGSLSLIHI